MSNCFSLYTVELRSQNPELLMHAPENFSENAEVVLFDRKSGKLVMQFMSTADVENVGFILDEFKKLVESNGSDRLIYKLSVASF